jgi:hypothetical protein
MVMGRPITSSVVHPNSRAAAWFQVGMIPSRCWLTIAPSDESTIAASRC